MPDLDLMKQGEQEQRDARGRSLPGRLQRDFEKKPLVAERPLLRVAEADPATPPPLPSPV